MTKSLHPRINITGVILCGGRSLRMGENKAFIQIDGVPMVRRIHGLFEKLFQEIIIVTNEEALFSGIDAKIYADLIPYRGVLMGLYTGLFFSSYPYSFCVGCDMPFVKASVIEYLIKNQALEGFDVIVPKTADGMQPLHAVYSKNCLPAIKETIDQGGRKITDFYPAVKVRVVEEREFQWLDPRMESFINVNTPAELHWVSRRKRTG